MYNREFVQFLLNHNEVFNTETGQSLTAKKWTSYSKNKISNDQTFQTSLSLSQTTCTSLPANALTSSSENNASSSSLMTSNWCKRYNYFKHGFHVSLSISGQEKWALMLKYSDNFNWLFKNQTCAWTQSGGVMLCSLHSSDEKLTLFLTFLLWSSGPGIWKIICYRSSMIIIKLQYWWCIRHLMCLLVRIPTTCFRTLVGLVISCIGVLTSHGFSFCIFFRFFIGHSSALKQESKVVICNYVTAYATDLQ